MLTPVLAAMMAALLATEEAAPAKASPPPPPVTRHVDTNDTRLLLGPTARALKKGEAYLDDFSLFFPSVNVGLSGRLSFGVGTVFLLPTTEVSPGEVGWLTPKVQLFSGRRTQAALGVVHITGKGTNSGIAYGVVTHGGPDGAISVGVGGSYATSGRGVGQVVMVGGERRVGQNLKLLSENYLSRTPLFLGGLRRLNRRGTVDLIWMKVGNYPVYPVPMVRFTIQMAPGR